jgi:hypothetical protein
VQKYQSFELGRGGELRSVKFKHEEREKPKKRKRVIRNFWSNAFKALFTKILETAKTKQKVHWNLELRMPHLTCDHMGRGLFEVMMCEHGWIDPEKEKKQSGGVVRLCPKPPNNNLTKHKIPKTSTVGILRGSHESDHLMAFWRPTRVCARTRTAHGQRGGGQKR